MGTLLRFGSIHLSSASCEWSWLVQFWNSSLFSNWFSHYLPPVCVSITLADSYAEVRRMVTVQSFQIFNVKPRLLPCHRKEGKQWYANEPKMQGAITQGFSALFLCSTSLSLQRLEPWHATLKPGALVNVPDVTLIGLLTVFDAHWIVLIICQINKLGAWGPKSSTRVIWDNKQSHIYSSFT